VLPTMTTGNFEKTANYGTGNDFEKTAFMDYELFTTPQGPGEGLWRQLRLQAELTKIVNYGTDNED